jgi:hypothetical protein
MNLGTIMKQFIIEIIKNSWKAFRFLFKNPKLVLALCGLTFGMGILFASLFRLELTITPADQRMGWVGDRTTIQAAGQGVEELQIKGATQSSEGAQVFLWDFVKQINSGKHFPTFRQETGDCVSMGASNAINYLQAVQIAKGEIGLQFHHAFQPYIYGISRTKSECGNGRLGRGAGSVGGWAAKGLKLYGALASDHEGVPNYSGKLADRWGYKGVPEQFVDVATEFKVQSYAKVTTYEQARDAISNGYPVTVASNQGFKMKPREYQGKHWGVPSGSWAHQMCFIGVDDKAESPNGKQGGLYILNSWGAKAHGTPLSGEPPGGFWVDRNTVNRMLGQNDSYAFSSFDGFPAQELDFRVFGTNKANVVDIEIKKVPESYSLSAMEYYTGVKPKTGLGIGGILSLISALYSIWQIFHGKKPINPFGKMAVVLILMTPAAAHADTLTFNVFDPGPVSVSKETLFLNVFDSEPTEIITDEDNPCIGFNCFESKPKVYAYKDLSSACSRCEILESEKDKLPVEIIWKQAPTWVTGYPTLHWKKPDGTWLQYQGWGNKSKNEFPIIYERSQQPAMKNERSDLIDHGTRMPL